jgi:L-aspartate oxidase
VFLDMTAVDPARFPNVVAALRESGHDPATRRIPVAPASHYVMGGIATDLDGHTTVPGLFAVGECACTGLHGANRLASNSLSECFVFGHRAALAGLDEPAGRAGAALAAPPDVDLAPPPTRGTRTAMWREVGLERSAGGLRRLLADEHPLARLVAASALDREESRGAHARADFPAPDAELDDRHSVVPAGAASTMLVEWQ